jgi:hypothetical protein
MAADALDGRGWYDLQEACAELEAVLAVLLPLPAGLDVLARMHLGRRPEHGDEVSMTTHLDPQHAEPRLRAVEGHALNKTGQRLSAVVERSPLGHVHISLPPGDNQAKT